MKRKIHTLVQLKIFNNMYVHIGLHKSSQDMHIRSNDDNV